MNFLQGVIWALKSVFEVEDGNLSMRIQQLQKTHPSYDIQQVRDRGRFTRYVTATDEQNGEHYHGTTDDVDLALRNQMLIDMAARGECQFTDIDFQNGCLYEDSEFISYESDSDYVFE